MSKSKTKFKGKHDPVLNYIRRQPVKWLKKIAVRMEIMIRDGWDRRHLEVALYNRVKQDTSENRLMLYYLYKG